MVAISLFILLSVLAVLLQKMDERNKGSNLGETPPPVRNDIKLQGSPFQVQKSYRLNPGSFFRVSPHPTEPEGQKELQKHSVLTPPPPQKETLFSRGVFFPRFGKRESSKNV